MVDVGLGCARRNHLRFFFQAEDGIRDADVTGVQTCALPISATSGGTITAWINPDSPAGGGNVRLAGASQLASGNGEILVFLPRSEERRVGKEGRSRWSPYH